MRQLIVIAAFFAVAAGWVAQSISRSDELDLPPVFRTTGYVPDYRLSNFRPAWAHGLTDLIIFSAELNDDGSLDLTRLKDCPWPKLLAFKTQQRVRLLLTIGGWERSKNFAAVTASAEKRKHCVRSIVQLCLDRRLDGIDLDWEHPTGGDQESSYGQLLEELRIAFTPHGLSLSATIAPWQRLSTAAIKSVDCVQVMAYDYADKHSTIEQTKADINALIKQGFPAEKIRLGLPFYGRDVTTRDAMTYAEIVASFNPDPAVDQVGSMYFNGPETIRRKVQFAIDSGLDGVMIWELGQDAPSTHSLLKVIREAASAEVHK